MSTQIQLKKMPSARAQREAEYRDQDARTERALRKAKQSAENARFVTLEAEAFLAWLEES